MSYCFNYANVNTDAIRASKCSIRILGAYITDEEAQHVVKQSAVETFTVSKNTWITLTHTGVINHGGDMSHLSAWNDWRQAEQLRVRNQTEGKISRSLKQIRAAYLLSCPEPVAYSDANTNSACKDLALSNSDNQHSKTSATATNIDKAIVQAMDESTFAVAQATKRSLLPSISRESEIRGQTWCLVAIFGDAHSEQVKQEILETLGAKYFQHLESKGVFSEPEEFKYFTCADDATMQSNVESAAQDIQLDAFDKQMETIVLALQQDIAIAKRRMQQLEREKQYSVSFLDVSDTPEPLIAKSEKAKMSPIYKHIVLGVVRMYEWIQLDHFAKFKQKVIHADSPQAKQFFETLQASSDTQVAC